MFKRWAIKSVLALAVLVCVAWLSVNWAKGQPYFSNPFADESVAHQFKQDTQRLLDSSRDALKSGADKVQRSFE